MNINRKFKFIAVAISVVMLLAVGLTTIAFAAGPKANTNQANQTGTRQDWGRCQGLGFPIFSDAVSKLLGMSVDEIVALRKEGKSLAEIAAAKGVNEQTLVETVLAARKEALQEKVAKGILTQEQADNALARMGEHVSNCLNKTALGPSEDKPKISSEQSVTDNGCGKAKHRGWQANEGTGQSNRGSDTCKGNAFGKGRGAR